MNIDALFKKVEATGWSTGRSFWDSVVAVFILFCALPYCLLNEVIPLKGLREIQLNEDPVYYWSCILIFFLLGVKAIYESQKTYKLASKAISKESI